MLFRSLERQPDGIEVAVDALPEHAHAADGPAERGARRAERLAQEPVLLDEHERGEIRDEEREVRLPEHVAPARLQALRLEHVRGRHTRAALVAEQEVLKERVGVREERLEPLRLLLARRGGARLPDREDQALEDRGRRERAVTGEVEEHDRHDVPRLVRECRDLVPSRASEPRADLFIVAAREVLIDVEEKRGVAQRAREAAGDVGDHHWELAQACDGVVPHFPRPIR